MNKKIADRIIRRLCEKLDEDVYMPVNYELTKMHISHSLGQRKEIFKLTIEQIVKEELKC